MWVLCASSTQELPIGGAQSHTWPVKDMQKVWPVQPWFHLYTWAASSSVSSRFFWEVSVWRASSALWTGAESVPTRHTWGQVTGMAGIPEGTGTGTTSYLAGTYKCRKRPDTHTVGTNKARFIVFCFGGGSLQTFLTFHEIYHSERQRQWPFWPNMKGIWGLSHSLPTPIPL